ncbi:uncharacterized protein METZ01_LOCUS453826, partial [marine metagenome]
MIPVRSRSGGLRFHRRDFLRAVPVGLATRLCPAEVEATQRTLVGSRAVLADASTLIGLEFTDAELALMQTNVARNARRYTELRQVSIQSDIEPAFS